MDSPPDSLSQALQPWKVSPPVQGAFRADVWKRIGDRTRETWGVYVRAHAAAWLVAATVVIGAAAYTGHATAQARVRADREALAVTYLVDLDPRVQAELRP